MGKWLLIGDPHIVAEELDDGQALIDGICQTIEAEEPDYVLFLGDQHHNHRVLDVEVMAFWRSAFWKMANLGPPIFALVGNHDMPGDASSKSHAMLAYEGIAGLKIVDMLMKVDGCLLVPYRHSSQDFINDVLCSPDQKVVFCHQTLQGATYENGFYAKDGADITGLEDREFISGHIHTPQRFGNVTYVGAPRWRSLSDAGIDRALLLLDITSGKLGTGRENGGKAIDTSQWCRKLIRVEVRQGQPLPDVTLPSRHRYIVDIHGDSAFCLAQKYLWPGCRVRTFKTQNSVKHVSESMGIDKAIQVFMGSYVPKYGTDIGVLRTMVNQRLGNS